MADVVIELGTLNQPRINQIISGIKNKTIGFYDRIIIRMSKKSSKLQWNYIRRLAETIHQLNTSFFDTTGIDDFQVQGSIAIAAITGGGSGKSATVGPDGYIYFANNIAGEIQRLKKPFTTLDSTFTAIPYATLNAGLTTINDIKFLGNGNLLVLGADPALTLYEVSFTDTTSALEKSVASLPGVISITTDNLGKFIWLLTGITAIRIKQESYAGTSKSITISTIDAGYSSPSSIGFHPVYKDLFIGVLKGGTQNVIARVSQDGVLISEHNVDNILGANQPVTSYNFDNFRSAWVYSEAINEVRQYIPIIPEFEVSLFMGQIVIQMEPEFAA